MKFLLAWLRSVEERVSAYSQSSERAVVRTVWSRTVPLSTGGAVFSSWDGKLGSELACYVNVSFVGILPTVQPG